MPIDYIIDVRAKTVVTHFRGSVGFEDIASHAKSLLQDPDFKPEYAEIVDTTQAVSISLDFPETNILAQHVDPFLEGSKRAIVANSAARIGSARMHQMLRRNISTCELFKCFEDAWDWVTDAEPSAIPQAAIRSREMKPAQEH